jgi:hypothetical protein
LWQLWQDNLRSGTIINVRGCERANDGGVGTFLLAFETNFPEDFLNLVQQLRETEISVYTLKDYPIFSCVRLSPQEMLDRLG